jgi:hypothetical protein
MKPLFTKAGPPLSETLPGWCGVLANCLSKPNINEAKAQVHYTVYVTIMKTLPVSISIELLHLL